MSGLSAHKTMELEVENFGPIVEGKVALRPLTVFMGPSNTGKSYLAILIYALHRYFGNDIESSRRRYPRMYRSFRIDRKGVSEEAGDALKELASGVMSAKAEDAVETVFPLSNTILDVLRSGFEAQSTSLSNEICRCFGIPDAKDLVRKWSRSSAFIGLSRKSSEDDDFFTHALHLGRSKSTFKTTFPNDFSLRIDNSNEYELERWRRIGEEFYFADDTDDEEWGFSASRILNNLAGIVLSRAFGPLDSPAYYLPADRTGVMHAHNVVVSALIERAAMAGLRPAANTPMLSGVLADFLEQLIELERLPRRRHRSLSYLATQLEQAILGGAIRVEKSEGTGYPRFTYKPERWKASLPLTNASSMVSELAPVILYLRYIVRSEDVVIVEEPESHLHPAMQVEFTRWLAALVRSGIRVLVTTHSEWVVEELSNVVRRSALPKVQREKVNGSDFYLDVNQVGAWLFEPSSRAKGSTVKEIRLDEGGLFASGFDRVAMALHNNWADIQGKIGAGK